MERRSGSRKPIGRRLMGLSMEDEIAHLRSLDLLSLHARWQSVVGRPAPEHLPKHLLFGILAYRIQADALGDLDAATVQLLKRAATVRSLSEVLPLVSAQDQRKQAMVPGTVLTREWNGQLHRVMAVEGGFAFEGKTFDSLSGIAFAITGTNWNGPRFFGLRAGNGKGVQP
ncbi:putative bacteriophage-related protein [Nitrobacter winogradskyi Nb-255]|uniref:Putative bacteriophage-related protein n=2 Tax=Nitrobacter winogradskyi TaxID=913 RepID=Q3SNE7_NITWN|nr:putative bacteriophage-related protein [Nitrobacter winogradskyi Nb-255]